jgi:crotonobetainyl-CoA:carnitine CoA-transferase CaiB-like acyl-CoA transferase
MTDEKTDENNGHVNRDPLAHLVVLELASILAGPMTGMFLAELGARVIKVENPRTNGDPTRGWKLPSEPTDTDVSSYFSCANWGKESIAVDLTTQGGRELVHDLVRRCDIVIQSFKPGDDEKLALDYASLRHLNPQMIYAQITAYGPEDPRPGFDAIIQAESGFTYLNGESDGPPTKMPVALVDLLLAHQLKEALLLALLKRERTGEGSYIGTSLLKAATASLANQATNWLVGGEIPKRMGSEHPNIAPYGTIYTTRDGRELVLAVGTDRQFQAFAAAIDLPELAAEPRFASNRERVVHRDELNRRVRARIGEIDRAPLLKALESSKVPFGLVNDMREVFEQPQSQALVLDGVVGGVRIRGVRSAVWDGDIAPDRALTAPPIFNEHSQQVFDFIEYTPERIAELRDERAIPQA